ncbi:MAG: nicotinate-nucleotide adenylyltransferase [Bacilli bacterium]|nr:nicotinate-nucleotide adenylyltransferase [Bacilli bacterium]
MNRIIFGGGFDPIHNGHLNIANNALKKYPGEVIFVPARISVWKEESVSSKDKINMLYLATKDNPSFKIDLFEINSEKEINYSIDTVNYLLNKYPDDKLFLLIGSDQVNKFHLWKESERIADKVQIIYYLRPGYEIDYSNVSKFHMEVVEGNEIDVSSTEIRNFQDFNLPLSVLRYIVEHNLYEGMAKIHSLIKEKRVAHSLEVAKLAYEIATKNKIKNPDKAFIAGLFHDIGKEMPLNEAEKIINEHYKEYQNVPKWVFHQFIGEYLAKTIFKINDSSILSAIRNHATGNKNMSVLDKIIYASDKIEPTRGFDSTELIKAMVEDAETGFVTVLKANKEYLESKGMTLDNVLTSNCFKQYL